MRLTSRIPAWAYAAALAVAVSAALVPGPAAAQRTSSAPALAPVTHPQDDHAGSTIAAHEGPAKLSAGPLIRYRTSGIDVSHWQGDISWPTVYAKGGRFVYIKATESTTFTDLKFARNYTRSAAAGLIRGAYHFALPDRSGGVAQADFLVNHGGGWSADGKTMPPMLDIEYNPYGPTCYGLSSSAMVGWLRAFSSRVHLRTGRFPTIYTTTNWWATCTGNNPTFGRTNPLFIARWASSVGTLPAGWTKYRLWQYANSGPLPGDQDRFNGSYDRLQTFAGP